MKKKRKKKHIMTVTLHTSSNCQTSEDVFIWSVDQSAV